MLGLLLSGCASPDQESAAKLCRSLLPYFITPDTRIDIRGIQMRAQQRGVLVGIAYDRIPASGSPTPHAFSCIIANAQTAAPEVLAVATDTGPLGPLRLHLLQSQWIAKGHAAISDPQPVWLLAPHIELRPALGVWVQALLSGLPALSVYALLAAAYALIYGLTGRINLAFGDLAMLAGFGTFLGASAVLASSSAALVVLCGLLVATWTATTHGYALGRLVLAPLLERPGQHVLIATLGLSIVWSELLRVSQGAGSRWLSPLFPVPWGIARAGDTIVTVTATGLLVPLVAAIALVGLWLTLSYTRHGRHWRAVADDPLAAELVGISPTCVLLRTLAMATFLTGLGGALLTLHFGGVGTGGGLVMGLKALIAAVIGGIGSVRGAILGAILVGVAETAWSVAFPIEYRDLALFCALAAVLILRPNGILRR